MRQVGIRLSVDPEALGDTRNIPQIASGQRIILVKTPSGE